MGQQFFFWRRDPFLQVSQTGEHRRATCELISIFPTVIKHILNSYSRTYFQILNICLYSRVRKKQRKLI